MAQDTALLRYLLKGARRAPGSGSQRDLAFAFDGTNDYISSNATIGRTGYDMNVSGNVSTGSDGDGSYIQFNGNRAAGAATGTTAGISVASSPGYTQANSFTLGGKFKVGGYAITTTSGLFGPVSVATISYTTTNTLRFTLRGSTTVYYDVAIGFTLGTAFYAHMIYDSATAKFYCYIDGILKNTGGTAGPATFNMSTIYLGDTAIGTGNADSSNKYIYHAVIRDKALTQAEIDADIALGNATKQDPSIVAYYIPDNLTYNTQYLANPKDLSNATWTKGTGTTVTANTTVAPDGTTTADQVVWTGVDTATSKVMAASSPSLSGATIASKTFIVKAFVKVSAGTATFRQWIAHGAVADYRSTDQTATTTRQEFTFTQTLTSSTSGTSLSGGICCSSTNTAATLEVRNVRLFLVNETLRDESPNIGGFIGWKTPLVMSARVKLGVDASDTTSSQVIIKAPRHYLQLRTSTNILYFRSETSLETRGAPLGGTAILGTGNRNKVHILGVKYRDGTGRRYKSYVNGVLTSGSQTAYSSTLRPAGTIYTTQLLVGKDSTATYYTGNIRDARIYTFTGSFTNADALAIYNGGEPTSSGIAKYLHYRPPVGEVGTTTQDQSTNDRDGTLNNGVTRQFI